MSGLHEKRRAFHTLDGIRGIAALVVVLFHIGPFYGLPRPPETFLAVDLFFLLSGFVVAHAYRERLERGAFLADFVKIRLIRLYPLYLLGLALACIWPILQLNRPTGHWTPSGLLAQIGLDLFMLGGVLNTPTWTLAPELLANFVYAAFIRRLTVPVLISVTAVGGLVMIAWSVANGSLNAGWAHNYIPALSRATFSFFFGVLLQKVIPNRRAVRGGLAWACLIVAGALLVFYPPRAGQLVYELALVLVVFPLLVSVACMCEPGQMSAKVFRFLGVISYAVYTLHEPLAGIIRQMVSHATRLNMAEPHPLVGLGFMVSIVLIAWLADRYYDGPVRRYLGRRPARLLPVTSPA